MWSIHTKGRRISSFFQHGFLDVFFLTFDASWCQNARFWVPLGTQPVPKWDPKSPKWRQNTPQTRFWQPLAVDVLTDLLLRSLSERSWAPFWLIFDGFGMKMHGFWHHVSKIFGYFSGVAFTGCRRRLPRNEIAENVKNM